MSSMSSDAKSLVNHDTPPPIFRWHALLAGMGGSHAFADEHCRSHLVLARYRLQ
jgi:hypothetical protein